MQSVHLQLPADLFARVDEAAGDVPRNRWIRGAIERELSTLAPDASYGDRLDDLGARIADIVNRDIRPRPKGGKK